MSNSESITPQKISPAILAKRAGGGVLPKPKLGVLPVQPSRKFKRVVVSKPRRNVAIDVDRLQEALGLGKAWRIADARKRRTKPTPQAKQADMNTERMIRAVAEGRVTPVQSTRDGRSDFGKFMDRKWRADDDAIRAESGNAGRRGRR